jgi:hypothetical protein
VPNVSAVLPARDALISAYINAFTMITVHGETGRVVALRDGAGPTTVDADTVTATVLEHLGVVLDERDAKAVAAAVRGTVKISAPRPIFGGAQ